MESKGYSVQGEALERVLGSVGTSKGRVTGPHLFFEENMLTRNRREFY